MGHLSLDHHSSPQDLLLEVLWCFQIFPASNTSTTRAVLLLPNISHSWTSAAIVSRYSSYMYINIYRIERKVTVFPTVLLRKASVLDQQFCHCVTSVQEVGLTLWPQWWYGVLHPETRMFLKRGAPECHGMFVTKGSNHQCDFFYGETESKAEESWGWS